MVAINFWRGEYPGPVIDIQPSKNGWSEIMGYSSLRNPANKKVCSVKAGTYHPWTKDNISLISYYSIIPRIDYVSQLDTILENTKVKEGDKLQREVYLSEGFCSYLFNGETKLETQCVDKPDQFQAINYPAHSSEQWLYLSCREGHKVFVQDSDLLNQPNVREGQISGYGEVS